MAKARPTAPKPMMKAAVSSSLAICNCSRAMKNTNTSMAYSEKVDTVSAPWNSMLESQANTRRLMNRASMVPNTSTRMATITLGMYSTTLLNKSATIDRPSELATVTIITRMISQ